MSIRSTNVFVPAFKFERLTPDIVPRHRYEERSLGVFEVGPEDEDEEPAMKEGGSRGEKVGQYFHWHLRRQVAYDIWWLVSRGSSLFSGLLTESVSIRYGESSLSAS
jgi:hypothetical protein